MFAAGDVADLKRQLGRLLEKPLLAREMGLAGQARVQAEFDIAAMGRTYRRHYDELLTLRRRCAIPEPVAQRL
jgi:glycosyltransferase involved in cell wall biosynthesis